MKAAEYKVTAIIQASGKMSFFEENFIMGEIKNNGDFKSVMSSAKNRILSDLAMKNAVISSAHCGMLWARNVYGGWAEKGNPLDGAQ